MPPGIRTRARKLCMLPRLAGVGGMVSFQAKMRGALERRGVEVCFSLEDRPYDAVLVVGGTRKLAGLWAARRRGIPVIQRLDGMNWIHRKRRTGLRHFLRAELSNLLLITTRDRIATGVVYQSEFAKDWWERVHGEAPVESRVVLNGVDLNFYTPHGSGSPPLDHDRMLVVEGTLGGGYELGLEYALRLAGRIQDLRERKLELVIVGRTGAKLRAEAERQSQVPIVWRGQVAPEAIPEIDRSAHFLYAADLHPACPNAVLEAMACGTPVVAFDTGALSEIVVHSAGELVPYGGDPWNLDPPDISGLAWAALKVLDNQRIYRTSARSRAEAEFGLERMLAGYLSALEWI
ncbi:MAG: glycosyltransferase family 4 protein [Anaerolineales bacterium]